MNKSYKVKIPARPDYLVVVASSGREVQPGDLVTDFRGEDAIFAQVTRGPVSGKSAKVAVHYLDGSEREFYAHVYGLAVTEK